MTFENSRLVRNADSSINDNWDISNEQSNWFGFSDEYIGEKNSSKNFSMEENDESTEDFNKQIDRKYMYIALSCRS